MRVRRWEYGIATISERGGRPSAIEPVTDEQAARELVAESYPWVVLYRRPKPKPWQLVPRQK